MSTAAEKVLIALLVDKESLEVLLRENLPEFVVPSEDLRPIVEWAKETYGRTRKAPSILMLKERFGTVLEDHEIDVDEEPDEPMEWVVDSLKANLIRAESARHVKDLIRDVKSAPPEEKVDTLALHVGKMSALVTDLTPRRQQADLRDSILDILAEHDERAQEPEGVIRGLRFGLPMVDEHYGGTHPGEVSVVAAPAKMGKSFFMTWCAYQNWLAGVPVGIWSLENSRDMTEKRIACQATGIDYNDLDRGRLSQADQNTLIEWTNDVLLASDTPLMVLTPDIATPHSMFQQALAFDLEGLIIDQLSHIKATRVRAQADRREIIQANMMDLHNLALHSRKQLPVIMAHQVNRDGIKNAGRTGRLSMVDMAESSEVERSADFVFGLYGSEDMVTSGMIQFQSLASRRVRGVSYDLHWHPAVGAIGVQNEVDLDAVA